MSKIIKVDHVSMQWDRRAVLSDIDFTVDRGDFIAITGPNGGGKSTLLRIMLRLLNPTSGRVIYYDKSEQVGSLPIGYLPQKNMIDSRFPITVRDVIESGLVSSAIGKTLKAEMVVEMAERMGLTSHFDKGIGELSGGQMQRALLGRALISNPEVLVLDEPLSYVDKKFEHNIYHILESLAGKATIVLVSHEMSAIASIANKHFLVDRTLHQGMFST